MWILALLALLSWPLAAFGGRSAATAFAFGATCLACAALLRPRISGPLDRALLIVLGAIAIQLIPLPRSVVDVLSPHAVALRTAISIDGGSVMGQLPITIAARSTVWGWMVVAGAVAFFWIARTQFRRSGVRRTVRGVSIVGFALSVLAIAQAATAGREIYWRYRTEFEGPLPFGPFVNRNHFATWVIMALPLCMGYVAARTGRQIGHELHVAARTRLIRGLDSRSVWLTVACTAMAIALLMSLSRSAMVALSVAAIATVFTCRDRLGVRRRRRLFLAAGIVAVFAIGSADLPALQERFAGVESGVANRWTIWRESLPIVHDFWLTGTGAGTYERSMVLYQRTARDIYFNQAHNHYLQVATEGGLLLVTAVVLALAAFARTARRRLAADATGLVWIRIGALCGLGAVALQSVWETGLVMPANAALAALLAAIAVHDRESDSSRLWRADEK